MCLSYYFPSKITKFSSGRVILKNKPLTRLLEVLSTTFPCQALKQPWKLMVVAGIPAALGSCGGWWAAQTGKRHRELAKHPPNPAGSGNLVLPQWQLLSHHSPVLPGAAGITGASRTGCREVISYPGEELKKYVPIGYGVTSLKKYVPKCSGVTALKHRVHRGGACVIKDDFISSFLFFFIFLPLTQDLDPPPLACCVPRADLQGQ